MARRLCSLFFLVFLSPVHAETLRFSTYLGGRSEDFIRAIALDVAGNIYVTGATLSSDFPIVGGIPGATGSTFVAKLDPTGSRLLYSTRIPSAVGSIGRAIHVDLAGNAYVGFGGMVAKIDPAGTRVLFSTFARENGGNVAAIALDTAGNILVAGDPAFVSKINCNGSGLIYSVSLGSGSLLGIAADAAGNAYVTGQTGPEGFPTTAQAFRTTFPVSLDIFLSERTSSVAAKISPTGALIYSTYLGAASTGRAIAVDAAGNAYIAGSAGPDFPTTAGAFQTGYRGGCNISPSS